MKVVMFLYIFFYFLFFFYLFSFFLCLNLQLYSVQLIPGKAEITEDKGMYSRASGGPRRPLNPRLITYSTCIKNIRFLHYGLISAKIRSCGFILPLRKNMITHSFTIINDQCENYK